MQPVAVDALPIGVPADPGISVSTTTPSRRGIWIAIRPVRWTGATVDVVIRTTLDANKVLDAARDPPSVRTRRFPDPIPVVDRALVVDRDPVVDRNSAIVLVREVARDRRLDGVVRHDRPV